MNSSEDGGLCCSPCLERSPQLAPRILCLAPRYEELHGEFVANGVDQIDRLSVTDADTMLAYLKGTEPQSISQPVRAFEG